MRTHRTFVVTALLAMTTLGLLTLHAQQPVAGGRPVLITGATLIDGTGRPPLSGAAILIEGDRISAVGRADEISAPANAEVIRADGRFVIPGLWESHMHYRWWHGELLLHHGITTMVDMGNQLEWIEAVKDGIAKGRVRAPRLFTSGWILHGTPPARTREAPPTITYRTQAYQARQERENYPNHVFVRGGPEKMREFVRLQIEAGVDAFKVFPDMSREELRAISAEADRAGIPVIGHVANTYHSVEDGLTVITHAHGIPLTLLSEEKHEALRAGRLATAAAWMRMDQADALIKFLVDREVFLGPCLIHDFPAAVGLAEEFVAEDQRFLARAGLNYLHDETVVAIPAYMRRYRNANRLYGEFPTREMLPPEVVAEFQRGYDNAKEFVRRFAKAGGRLFIGTDMLGGSPSIPGLAVHREMRVWVEEVGLTPMQALLAATRDSAAMMRKDSMLGTIEPGKIADLVVLAADPLADIRHTEKIERVMKAGAFIDRTLSRDYFVPFREIGSEGAHNVSLAVPTIISLEPRVVVEGAPDTKVVLEGAGLHISSKVFVNDHLVPSAMLDEEHLEFTIPAHLLAYGGSVAVRVVNGAPGGGTSTPYGFVVRFR